MAEKLKFIFWVMVALAVTYVVLTISMPIISGLAFESANTSSVANFGSAQAGLRWVPLFLYIVPAPIALGLIVWKLKQGER